jgi:hypothetical protein
MASNPRLWDLTVGTPASIEFGCFRNRTASPRAPKVFQPRLSVHGRDPHDCSDASYVGRCNDGRPGLRTDRPRLRVRGDRGPDRRPSLDGADGDGQNIQSGLSEIVRHDHRAKARKVEGGARQRRPMSMLRTQVRPIAPGANGPRDRRPRCSPTWPAWVRTWDFETR